MIPSAASMLSQITTQAVVFSSSSVSLGIAIPLGIVDALENATRDDMLQLSQEFFRCVLYSAGAVAFGCILEGPEILHELFPRLTSWFTWQSNERLHRFERRIKKIAAVGWLLICLGVLGEGVFELLQNKAESQLQTFNDILLKDARLTAIDAQNRAATTESENLQLSIELQREEQNTARAVEEAALVNDKLGGWKLDGAAKKRVTARLMKFSGTPFDLAVNPVEAPFMEELDALLTSPSVGWVRLPPKADSTLMAILIDGKATIILSSGIVLEVDQDQVDSLKPALTALGTAFHEELALKNVTLHLVPAGSWGKRIHIIIGKRE